MYITRESDRVRNMQKEIMEKNKAKIPFSHIQNKDPEGSGGEGGGRGNQDGEYM